MWVFGDPLAGTLAILRAHIAPAGLTPTWGTVVPDTTGTGAPTLPHGLVASDGEASLTVADAAAIVRVSVWAGTEVQARMLAGWARAVLLACPGDGVNIRHFGRGTGLLPADDGGFPVCSFTVAARLLPVSI